MSGYEQLFPRCRYERPCGGLIPPPKDCRTACRPYDDCRAERSVRVPVFGGRCGCCDPCRLPPAAPPVTVVNPWNPCEKAVVILMVDECGDLVVCVKR